MSSMYLTVRTNATKMGMREARTWRDGIIMSWIIEPIVKVILELEHGEIIFFVVGTVVIGYAIKKIISIENSLPEDQQAINIIRASINENINSYNQHIRPHIPENVRRNVYRLSSAISQATDAILDVISIPTLVVFKIVNYFFVSPFLSLTN